MFRQHSLGAVNGISAQLAIGVKTDSAHYGLYRLVQSLDAVGGTVPSAHLGFYLISGARGFHRHIESGPLGFASQVDALDRKGMRPVFLMPLQTVFHI